MELNDKWYYYLAHFHLLTLLGPSLRVQPPDRDVRVLIATCSSQNLGDVDLDLLWSDKRYPATQPWKDMEHRNTFRVICQRVSKTVDGI